MVQNAKGAKSKFSLFYITGTLFPLTGGSQFCSPSLNKKHKTYSPYSYLPFSIDFVILYILVYEECISDRKPKPTVG